MSRELFFRQLFDYDTWTYSYLIADPETREAALIDPVKEQVSRDLNLIKELNLQLKYIIETHVHADHITGAEDIRQATGAKSIVGFGAHVACADKQVKDGEEIDLGSFKIKALSTPGHTDGCMSYVVSGRVFTGDALLIRGTGRTDFQQGSPGALYHSIIEKLFPLPDDTLVYPAHDYHGLTVSTIGEEKKYNPRVGGQKSEAEFVEIMANLKLAMPKKIQIAVPANMACGADKADENSAISASVRQG
ncbi:MAG: MBL fold metallo-hydrolase [Deltaproteobacteria bacterium]|nr:MBL fold metallo-hydrolase [Deltaproteobacteria bacterium]